MDEMFRIRERMEDDEGKYGKKRGTLYIFTSLL